MRTFAFVVSPMTIKQLKTFWPPARIMPNFIIKLFLKDLPPFKLCHLRIKSIKHKEIQGHIIICPLLIQNEELALDKIITCANLAQRLGAKIVGLSGHAAFIANKEQNHINKNLKIPVTTGSAFITWSVFEAVYRLSRTKNIDLKKSRLAIIGATNIIGGLCAKKLSDYSGSITLVGEDKERLEQLKERISQLNPIEITVEQDIQRAVKEADIVVNANHTVEIANEDLKQNAIICNIFPPGTALKKQETGKNITVIAAGLVKLPFADNLDINIGLPKGIAYASLAEVMLLAFEEKFVTYSLGENINLEKSEEMADISARHGFEVWVPEAPVL